MDRFFAWWESHGSLLLAIAGAAIAKVVLSENLTWKQAAGTIFLAVFCAYLGTEPFMRWWGISPQNVELVAAGIALTGEQIARALLKTFNDPDWIKEIIVSRLKGGDK